jgi:hypothetical protein
LLANNKKRQATSNKEHEQEQATTSNKEFVQEARSATQAIKRPSSNNEEGAPFKTQEERRSSPS